MPAKTDNHCFGFRSTKVSNVVSKRKRHELQEDFEENLVAELCMRFDFPSVLWLKATCLPTILHRITRLLQAEELRQKIAREIRVGCIELPPGKRILLHDVEPLFHHSTILFCSLFPYPSHGGSDSGMH